MPFLPSSGAISIGTLNSFFAGSGTSLSNFYRGGARVPATKTTTTTTTEGPFFSPFEAPFYLVGYDGENNQTIFQWDTLFFYVVNGFVDSVTVGGVTYAKNFPASGFWAITRSTTSTVTVNINTGVPSSGTISLSNFYGAERP